MVFPAYPRVSDERYAEKLGKTLDYAVSNSRLAMSESFDREFRYASIKLFRIA